MPVVGVLGPWAVTAPYILRRTSFQFRRFCLRNYDNLFCPSAGGVPGFCRISFSGGVVMKGLFRFNFVALCLAVANNPLGVVGGWRPSIRGISFQSLCIVLASSQDLMSAVGECVYDFNSVALVLQ